MDAELEQALQASLTMLAWEVGFSDANMEDAIVLAATTDSSHDTSTAPSSLHKALQRPDATEWTEAICHEMDLLTHL